MPKRLLPPSPVAVWGKRILLVVVLVVCVVLGVLLGLHVTGVVPLPDLVDVVIPDVEPPEPVAEPKPATHVDLSGYYGEISPEKIALPYVALTPVPEAPLVYEEFHPEMCFEYPTEFEDRSEKKVFFTFDDGPSPVTDSILHTLNTKGVKGTFFIMGNGLSDPANQARLKRMAAEGHTIGIHTQTHDYNKVYSSVGAYLADFYAVWNTVYEITGVKSNIFRFPGGSINGYNKAVYRDIVAEMTRRGFVYYDWNVSAEDAVETPATVESILDNATRHGWRNQPVVLMHDSVYKKVTAQALGSVIDVYVALGYVPSPLTNTVKPMQF